jgi:hypothetical protein
MIKGSERHCLGRIKQVKASIIVAVMVEEVILDINLFYLLSSFLFDTTQSTGLRAENIQEIYRIIIQNQREVATP